LAVHLAAFLAGELLEWTRPYYARSQDGGSRVDRGKMEPGNWTRGEVREREEGRIWKKEKREKIEKGGGRREVGGG
jgi:hypothetical protein